jgi:CBS domain-containing protein
MVEVSELSRIEGSKTNTVQQIFVKDVMTSPFIAVREDSCIPLVARLMEDYYGSVVVSDKQGNPLGIITERDLVTRVLAKITDKGLLDRVLGVSAHIGMLTAGEVMSSPLIVITPDETLVEAARKMRRHNIRRLGVVSNGKLEGIVSSKDMLAVTPELIEILQEEKKITEIFPDDFPEHLAIPGYCEQCGNWSSALKDSNGNFLCEECTVSAADSISV